MYFFRLSFVGNDYFFKLHLVHGRRAISYICRRKARSAYKRRAGRDSYKKIEVHEKSDIEFFNDIKTELKRILKSEDISNER